ncbi:hypothetical protein P8C59_006797 [Phyllachora maydis]|uniref:4'-phosphopantetheinyl transferase domain-containing protein n=1 Tax=Phyllachora maydis TaxID=1825666 RepID=A0AAD9I747_9PEZI|nr:hypothetical protein P8C59_006797 [Phyllachora maydis]
MARRVLAFPLAVHMGTDICRIPRIYTMLGGPRGGRFIRRILADEELVQPRRCIAAILLRDGGHRRGGRRPASPAPAPAQQRDRRDPELWTAAVFLAGRFAAKEAAIKAHPHRRLTFHDVVIENRAGGADAEGARSGVPSARIKGGPGAQEEDQVAMLSISHDGDYATAVCMGFEAGPGGARG